MNGQIPGSSKAVFKTKKGNEQVSSFMTYHRVCNYINMTGATSRAGTYYPSRAPEFIPGF